MGECYGTVSLAAGDVLIRQGVMMGYAVGVDFGSVLSTAGIVKWDNQSPTSPESMRVSAPVPSVAYVNSADQLQLGSLAHRLGEADPQRVIRDFKGRVGDPVPIMIGAWSDQAENIVAAVIRQMLDDIAADESAAPDAIAITHPASWGAYKQQLLAAALARAGLVDVTLVPEPQAAATYAAQVAPFAGATVLVYDLGAGSCEATVMGLDGDGGYELLGHSQAVEWGGSDFDQAIFSHVQRAAGLGKRDSYDSGLLTSLSRLRADCRDAKELLSIDTEATITVAAMGRMTRIRLVRSEFEELIRDAIEDTVDTMRRAISSAGLTPQDIDAMVLVGGSARIPLVAQLVSAEFSRPIVIDTSPGASTSLGAAWLARAAVQAKSVVDEDSLAADPVAVAMAEPAQPAEPTEPADQAPAFGPPSPPALVPQSPRASEPPTPRASEPVVVPDPAAAEPPPASTPAASNGRPTPVPGGNAGPGGRRDQLERRGRHRRQGVRRYWIQLAGVIAAVAVIITAGSALATSEAGNRDLPMDSKRANGANTSSTPAAGPMTIATTDPSATAPTAVDPTATVPTIPDANGATANAEVAGQPLISGGDPPLTDSPAPVTPEATQQSVPWLVPDAEPDAVNAPAVILNLSELLPADPAAADAVNDPSGSGVPGAAP